MPNTTHLEEMVEALLAELPSDEHASALDALRCVRGGFDRADIDDLRPTRRG